MKKVAIIFLCIPLMLTSGCRDKKTRAYAEELAKVLGLYAEQVALKIKAEEASYRESEKIYGSTQEDEVSEVLRYERIERSNRTVDTLAATLGHKARSTNPVLDQFAPLTLAKLQDDLRAYGQLDFDSTRVLLEQELSARKRYLNNLQSLQFELARVKALQESLLELAEAKSGFQQLKDMATFVTATREAYNELACDDLTGQIKANTLQADNLKKQVAEAKTKAEKATAIANAASPADKPARENDARIFKLEQEKLEAKLTAVNQEISNLTARKNTRKCQ